MFRFKLALPVLFLSSLACILGDPGDGGTYSPPALVHTPKPNFIVGDTNVSDACAGFFEDCSRADCVIINAGDAPGTIVVQLTVTNAAGQTLTHGETLNLAAGDRKTIQHDFSGFKATYVQCGDGTD